MTRQLCIALDKASVIFEHSPAFIENKSIFEDAVFDVKVATSVDFNWIFICVNISSSYYVDPRRERPC